MASILDKIPPPVKSLWNSEVALRKALQNAVFRRPDEARTHWDDARRHFNEALAGFKARPDAPEATQWGGYEHTEKTLRNNEEAETRQAEAKRPEAGADNLPPL